jgi:hypothetical protein
MSASAALGHQRTRPPARPRIEHHLHRFRRTERLHPNIHFRVTSASDLLVAWSACRNLVPTSCVPWRDGREVNDETRPNPEPGS